MNIFEILTYLFNGMFIVSWILALWYRNLYKEALEWMNYYQDLYWKESKNRQRDFERNSKRYEDMLTENLSLIRELQKERKKNETS